MINLCANKQGVENNFSNRAGEKKEDAVVNILWEALITATKKNGRKIAQDSFWDILISLRTPVHIRNRSFSLVVERPVRESCQED